MSLHGTCILNAVENRGVAADLGPSGFGRLASWPGDRLRGGSLDDY